MPSRRIVKKAVTLLALAALGGSARTARAEFPTLERSIQLARARAIVVAEAEAEVGVARAQMAGARQSIFGNPYVDLQIDKGINTTQSLQVLGYAYFPVDLTGQRGARIDEAQKLIKWRELGVDGARGQATGEAVAVYGEMVLGQARVNAAVAGEQGARDEAKYFQGRLAAKDTTIYETSLAEAEVARWVQSHAEATLRLASARARFAQLTGTVEVEAPPENANPSPPPLKAAWDDPYIAKLVDRAPIIVRLTAEKHYWESSIDRYKAERIPPVAFELIGGQGASGEARLGGGLVLTFPVSRRYQGEISRAEHAREHVVAHLSLYRNIIESRLRSARDAYNAVEKAVKELDANGMPALERAVSASNEAFKLGKIELTRVLLARRDLALARARRLDLIEASWRAYADLTILSGDLP